MFPLDLSGPQFLALYAGCAVAALAGAEIYKRRKLDNGTSCSNHPLQIDLDPFDIAFLRSGQAGIAQTAVASLVHGNVIESRPDSFQIHKEEIQELHPIAAELRSRLDESMGAKELRTATDIWRTMPLKSIAQVERKLENAGLVLTKDRASVIGMSAALIAGIPMWIGVPKLLLGLSTHKPIAFLGTGLFITFIVALNHMLNPVRRTTRGDQVLKHLEKQNAALKTTASNNPDGLTTLQIGTAAALFGPAIFSGGLLGDYYRRILPPSSGGSGCGSGSSCGSSCGGGGCGGGCGGCGG